MISHSIARRPRNYDQAMEVLATLPLASNASVSQLARDFGLTLPRILNVLGKLRDQFGIEIEGRQVRIAHGTKASVKSATESYWSRTWDYDLN